MMVGKRTIQLIGETNYKNVRVTRITVYTWMILGVLLMKLHHICLLPFHKDKNNSHEIPG